MAFALYTDSNNDTFPGAASKGSYKPMAEDWIFWNTYDTRLSGTIFRDPQKSAIAPYIGRFNTNLFRCPSDRDVLKRQQQIEKNPKIGNLYLYSYVLNSYVDGSQNRGMSSLYDPDGVAAPLHFRAASIKNPTRKIMLVDERSANDNGTLAVDPDDGRWVPPGNLITKRHQSKGTVAFPDSHVETVDQKYGTTIENYDPMR